jgi:hypothetical protein
MKRPNINTVTKNVSPLAATEYQANAECHKVNKTLEYKTDIQGDHFSVTSISKPRQ